MPENPLEKAIAGALSANEHLGTLFNRIGNNDHPRGIIPTAYRNAHRAMISALKERQPLLAADEVMLQLRNTIQTSISSILSSAQTYGSSYAQRQLAVYKLEDKSADLTNTLLQQVYSGAAAVSSVIEQQRQVILAMIANGVDTDMILGDDERVGILRLGDVIAASAYWTALLLWSAFEAWILPYTYNSHIKKLAVAALDPRTTDCCLRVHGQVQSFKQPFHLTGTPRFADELQWAPFHRFCRTSITLYIEEYDYGITEDMKNRARGILATRAP